MIRTPRELAALSEITALAARIEARTGKRVSVEEPGRGCFIALLDGVPVRGVYGSRCEAVGRSHTSKTDGLPAVCREAVRLDESSDRRDAPTLRDPACEVKVHQVPAL